MRSCKRQKFHFTQPSLTKQAPAKECNINNIIKKFKATGLMPVRETPIVYGDSTGVDFQTDQYALAELKSEFESLSPSEQSQFGDPAAFLKYRIEGLEAALKATESETKGNPKGNTQNGSEEPPEETEVSTSRSNVENPDST